jgi:hypothetical protein
MIDLYCTDKFWKILILSLFLYGGSTFGLLFLDNTIFAPSLDPKNLYFVVCTLVKNEGKYLQEWIEFHYILGYHILHTALLKSN